MIRSIALTAFALVAVLATLYFGSALATANVSQVRLEGQLSAAEGAQVRRAVADELARPGLRTAADVVAAVKALGWIREVSVRHHWPDTLHIAVARETLAARWGEDAWLTTSGSIVPAADAEAEHVANLPTFRTLFADAPRAMRVFNLLNESAANAGLRIRRLEENLGGEWHVLFDNDLEVILGSADISERFGRFVAVYQSTLRDAPQPLDAVDARYDMGVAVRWRSATAFRQPKREAHTVAWSNDG